jgi:hypothetical protein
LNQNFFFFTRSISNGRADVSLWVPSATRRTEARTRDLKDSGLDYEHSQMVKSGIHTLPLANPEMAVKRCFPSTHRRTLAWAFTSQWTENTTGGM